MFNWTKPKMKFWTNPDDVAKPDRLATFKAAIHAAVNAALYGDGGATGDYGLQKKLSTALKDAAQQIDIQRAISQPLV